MDEYERLMPLLEKGYIYGHGRDKFMRPQIFINARKIVDDDVQLEELLMLNTFMSAYIRFNAMVPGRIEQLSQVLDVKGLAITEIPVKRLGALVATAKNKFPHIGAYGIVINTSWIL